MDSRQKLYSQALKYNLENKLDSSNAIIKKYLLIENNLDNISDNISSLNLLSSNYLLQGNSDSAKYYLDMSRKLCLLENHYPNFEIQIEEKYGKYFFQIAEYESSLVKYTHALNMSIELYGNQYENLSSLYKNIASAYLMLNDTCNANIYFNESIHRLRNTTMDDSVEIAKLICDIGSDFNQVGLFQKAIKTYSTALKFTRDIDRNLQALINYNIIITYFRMGKLDVAVNVQKNLFKNFNNEFEDEIESIDTYYDNFGYYHLMKGEYRKAEFFLKKAVKFRLKAYGHNHPDLFYSYSYLGTTYFYLTDYDSALEYYLNALFILNKNPETFSPINNVYCNILLGNVYKELGKIKESIDSYTLSLSLLNISEKTYIDYEIISYINLGLIYFESCQIEDSKRMLNIAIKRLPTLKNEMPLILSQIYFNIAELFLKFDELDNSNRFYMETLKYTKKYIGLKHPIVAVTNNRLGQIYERNNKLDSALFCYQRSIISSVYSFNNDQVSTNPELDELIPDVNLLSTLIKKSRLLRMKYQNNLRNEYAISSLSTYILAIELFEQIRMGFNTQESKLKLSENNNEIFREAINVAFELFKMSKDKDYINLAFRIAEKNKAFMIKQSLKESSAKYTAGIPDSLISKERELINRLDYFYTLYNQQQNNTLLSNELAGNYYRTKLFELRQEYDFLIDYFEDQYPQYYELKYNNSTITINEIQYRLDENTILMEYVDLDDHYLIFVISKDFVSMNKIKPDIRIKEIIEDFRNGISTIDYALYTENAYKLYQELIQPVVNNIAKQKLILILDGTLTYIPFEALLTEAADKNKNDYRSLSYFIKKYQINYEYSATLLFKNFKLKHPISNSKFYGFAPITYN